MIDGPPRLPELVVGTRVVLRRWVATDTPGLAAAVERNIEHLRPWMPWIATEPLDWGERVALIESWAQAWVDGKDVILGVFMGEGVIGGCGLHRRRGPHGLELGYWIDKDHTNRGIGTEVGALLTSAALRVRGMRFVEIHHDKANVVSRRIPEHLGYKFLGETPGHIEAPGEVGIDCGWRMDAADWHER
jgi:RimJ/RimL family protein N-acetyltransferase